MPGGAPAPISDHAIVGDGRSAALVTRGGTVDWLCWPRFDSDACFARLLDPDGGAWSIAPTARHAARHRYLPGTNVLETRFETAVGGAASLLDFMPATGGPVQALAPERALLRIARCERGEVELEIVCDPRPGFGRAPRRWRDAGALGARLESDGQVWIFCSAPRVGLAGDAIRGRVRLRAGETACFALTHATESPSALPPTGGAAEAALRATVRMWRGWAARSRYTGPFREAVERSALALKLLAHAPSGGIVAAPTTSLPEQVGGFLNWDYRYCWLRDASFTVRALFGLGYHDEAAAFVTWLLHSTRLTRPELRVLYDVYGRAPPRERDLPLDGYLGSRPVRVGNAAKDQLQLDVYGEVIDATSQLVNQGIALDRETARLLSAMGEYVCAHWRDPDESIWEPRGGRRHHTYSKVLCWAALDRLLELHRAGHLRHARADDLARERAAIRRDVEANGWNAQVGSYTQTYGSTAIDAALLQLPWYGFVSPSSPRMRRTVARIERELGAGGGLLYRYQRAPGWHEGAFGICGFWAAEWLAIGGGSAADAESRISALLRTANDVGLLAEETDPDTGDALGNFPQAFTHIGLVNACLSLEHRLTGERTLAHQHGLPPADEVASSGGPRRGDEPPGEEAAAR